MEEVDEGPPGPREDVRPTPLACRPSSRMWTSASPNATLRT